MHLLRLLWSFARVSLQEEMASRAHVAISLLHSLLNLATGVLALTIVFGQTQALEGWTYPGALALLGVYLILSATNRLVIGTSLNALAGLMGEIYTGAFDYTLLRPVPAQFLASFRKWQFMAVVDMGLAMGVLIWAMASLDQPLTLMRMATFGAALASAATIYYALLLSFAALVLWSPGLLFTWVFNSLWQLARYPVGIYPGWLRLVLTWIVPITFVTTVPAQALVGSLSPTMMGASIGMALLLLVGASQLFRIGLGRYASASS